jgi:hypothetical protein
VPNFTCYSNPEYQQVIGLSKAQVTHRRVGARSHVLAVQRRRRHYFACRNQLGLAEADAGRVAIGLHHVLELASRAVSIGGAEVEVLGPVSSHVVQEAVHLSGLGMSLRLDLRF